MSLKDISARLNVKPWRISYLFISRKLPEVPRVAGNRVFVEEDIPKIKQALALKHLKVKKETE